SAVEGTRIRSPRLCARFTRRRNRMELPCQLARVQVEVANISDRRSILLAWARADQQGILPHPRRRNVLHIEDHLGVALQAELQIHVIRLVQLPGRRVDLAYVIRSEEHDAPL